MNSPLVSLWMRIEADRQEILRRVSLLEPALHRRRRHEHAWSIVQILEHLIKSEAAMLAHSKVKQRARARPVRLRTRIRFIVMKMHFAVPVIKVRAPLAAIVPSEEPSLEVLEAKWARLRDEWRDYLQQLSDDEYRLGIFNHPLVGPLTPNLTLTFIHMHSRHHARQIMQTIHASSIG